MQTKCSVRVLRKSHILAPHRSVRTSKALTVIWIISLCLFLLSLAVTLHTLNKSVISSLLFKSVTNAMNGGMFRLRYSFVTGVAERDNPFCHHAKRGGRKHTGKKRKLEMAEGVVNILQRSETTLSEHVKHDSLTSDFDAALISETHCEREKLVTAAQEARQFSWAGPGSAAISTASNGTSAGVLALVRTRWFSKPFSICTDGAGVPCPDPRLAGGVYTLFRALRRFPQRHQRQFDARRVFSHEKQKAGADFNFPPSLWQDLSMQGGSLWLRKLGASVVISEGTTHACRAGKG